MSLTQMNFLSPGNHTISFKAKSTDETEFKGLGMDIFSLEGYEFTLYKAFSNRKASKTIYYDKKGWEQLDPSMSIEFSSKGPITVIC